jgi:hypothetical protein
VVAVDRNQNCASHLLANRDRLLVPEDGFACCLQEASPVA